MGTPLRGLFGRDREIDTADAALEAAASGEPRVLLVGGDAGIGKTSLVNVVVEHARARGFRVLVGHCLDIDDGVALRPVREALRQAVAGRPDESLSPVTRRLAAYLRGEADAVTVDELALVVTEQVDEGPLLLVLEDLHWADRSTIDLVTSLTRTASGPLCLVLTYRTDEIGRKHPFRSALAELVRHSGTVRTDLSALGLDDIAALVEARGGRVGGSFVRELHARSEGNPLYAEELVAAGAERLPEALNDLLLARVDGLSDETRAVMRLASAQGSRLWPELLAEATALPPEALDRVLAEAVEAHVVRRAGARLDFRHGLVREAVYDDLLPGERTQAHGRLAEALERMMGGNPDLDELGLLAFHWERARDVVRSYAATVRAGQQGFLRERMEAAVFLERAVDLYDQVSHDGGPEDPSKAEMLSRMARAADEMFERDRARRLITSALDLVDEAKDPMDAASVYIWYGRMTFELEGRLTHEEALARAIDLLGEAPSEKLALALNTRASVHMHHEHMLAAASDLERAVEVAHEVGSPDMASKSLIPSGWCQMWLGRLPEALAAFEMAAQADRRLGVEERLLSDDTGRAVVLMQGLDVERGLALIEDVIFRARADRLANWASWPGIERANALVHLGRLADAEAGLAAATADGSFPADSCEALTPLVRIFLLRGEPVAALSSERRRMALMAAMASMPNYDWVLVHVQVLVANRLAQEAIDRMRDWLRQFAHSDSALGRAVVAHGAYLATEAGRDQGIAESDELLAETDLFFGAMEGALGDAGQRSFLGHSTPVSAALRAELHGERSADLWRAAYDAAAHVGPGLALPVRLRLLGALLTEGHRDEARTSLPEARRRCQGDGHERRPRGRDQAGPPASDPRPRRRAAEQAGHPHRERARGARRAGDRRDEPSHRRAALHLREDRQRARHRTCSRSSASPTAPRPLRSRETWPWSNPPRRGPGIHPMSGVTP